MPILVYDRCSSSPHVQLKLIFYWVHLAFVTCYYGGPQLIGPNVDGKNSEVYRCLYVPKVLFNMVPRNIYCALLHVRRHPPFPSVAYSIISAFSACFCNPSSVSNSPTKSSAYLHPDTVSSPTVNPCFAASTATISSHQYFFLYIYVRICIE